MRVINNSSWFLAKLLTMLILSTSVIGYTFYFHEYLSVGEWQHISGFTRISIPDTFVYLALSDEDTLIISALLGGVKNALGPSVLWHLASSNWYVIALINIIIIATSLLYLEKILIIYDSRRKSMQLAIMVFIFSPATLYYSIGSLKELPMILLLLMTLYYYLRHRWWLLLFSVAALLLLRYQLASIIFLLFILSKFKRNGFIYLFYSLAIFGSAYPFVESLPTLSQDTIMNFRAEYGHEGGLGGVVEGVRGNIYGASLIAILIRVIQATFDPFISFLFRFSFIEDGSLSVFSFVQFFTLAMYLPYLILAIRNLVRVARNRRQVSIEVKMLFMAISASFFFVGGCSFIHHRYLYPFFPLLLIAALLKVKPMNTEISIKNG